MPDRRVLVVEDEESLVLTLQDRLKAFGKNEGRPVGHVHVFGAGTTGGDIAAWCALRGLNVTLIWFASAGPPAAVRSMR